MFLPLVFRAVGAKGSAGIDFYVHDVSTTLAYSNELVMGINWGYQWNWVFTPTYPSYAALSKTVGTMPYQIVNDIRSKPARLWDTFIQDCPGNGDPFSTTESYINSAPVQAARQACVADIARRQPGRYWMLWNEPDLQSQPTNDNISPSLAISYFVVISNTILKSDPTARLIVGNVGGAYSFFPDTSCAYNQGCGVFWLSRFITEGHSVGITVTDFIAGYGFHAYGTNNDEGIGGALKCAETRDGLVITTADGCLTKNFTLTVNTAQDWLANYDPGKELWLTEFNWIPSVITEDTYIVQVRRMGQMCDELRKRPVTRYGWNVSPSNVNPLLGVLTLFQESPYSGALSDSGIRYATC